MLYEVGSLIALCQSAPHPLGYMSLLETLRKRCHWQVLPLALAFVVLLQANATIEFHNGYVPRLQVLQICIHTQMQATGKATRALKCMSCDISCMLF